MLLRSWPFVLCEMETKSLSKALPKALPTYAKNSSKVVFFRGECWRNRKEPVLKNAFFTNKPCIKSHGGFMQASPLLESYFLYWTSLTHVSYECIRQPSSKRHGNLWVSDCLRLVPRKTVLRTNPSFQRFFCGFSLFGLWGAQWDSGLLFSLVF